MRIVTQGRYHSHARGGPAPREAPVGCLVVRMCCAIHMLWMHKRTVEPRIGALVV